MAVNKVEFDIVGRDVSGSKAFDQVAGAADKAADKLDDLGTSAKEAGEQVKESGGDADGAGKQYRGLAAEIERTREEMRRLAVEIDQTGNMDLAKDLRRQQSELRKLLNVQKAMGEAGEEGAEAFSESFSDRLKSSLSQVSMAPPLRVAAGAAAPVVASAVAAGVVGGIATGVAGIGVAIAAQDSQVKVAGKNLGATLAEGFKDAAQPFVPATLGAIDTVRDGFEELRPQIEDIFADAAQYVKPLTEAGLGFVRNMLPGIEDAVDRAGPFFDMLGEELPELGTDLGEFFSTLSQHADEGARAIGGLADALGVLLDAGSVISDVVEFFGEYGTLMRPADEEIVQHLMAVKPAGEQAAEGVRSVATAARSATEELRAWQVMMDQITQENFTARSATRDFEAAIDAASDAVRRNGATFDENTPKGRENAAALDAIASSANAAAEAVLAQSGDQEAANAILERGRTQFLKLADAMDMDADAAERLADMLFAIPASTPARVKTNAAAERAEAERLRRKLEEIEGTYFASVQVSYTEKGNRYGIGNSGFKGHAEGGRVYGPGTGTSDDIVTRVSNGEYVVREAAARAIGYDTLDAINQADRRPGAVTPSRIGDPGHRFQHGGGSVDDLYRALVRALQTLPIYRVDAGRDADIYARGG